MADYSKLKRPTHHRVGDSWDNWKSKNGPLNRKANHLMRYGFSKPRKEKK